MFESSKIPNEWANILNNYFDIVVVPDSYLIEIYKNSGVNLPIFVLPLSISIEELLKLPKKNYQINHLFLLVRLLST